MNILPGAFNFCASAFVPEVKAWVYPEHRQIGLLTIENLSPGSRAKLELFCLLPG
jgi:hypothetical protein